VLNIARKPVEFRPERITWPSSCPLLLNFLQWECDEWPA
jgi:hypothetical protein